ncbi:hypothetical protein, partial [Bacteroides heparinolyticus]|uniref:hypothetical protein n=1 Tax=Prevotella heparinolytica TaxID=28113 RepID=UPI003AEF38B5
ANILIKLKHAIILLKKPCKSVFFVNKYGCFMLLSMFFTFKKSKNKKTAYHNAPPHLAKDSALYTLFISIRLKKQAGGL